MNCQSLLLPIPLHPGLGAACLFLQREAANAQARESRPLLLLTAAAGARGGGRREPTRTFLLNFSQPCSFSPFTRQNLPR